MSADDFDDSDDPVYRFNPRHRAFGPGRTMRWVGLFSIVVTILIVGFIISQFNQYQANSMERTTLIFIRLCPFYGLLATLYFSFIIWAGGQMLQCQNDKRVKAATISMVCLGVVWLPLLPVGIWAIVTLNHRWANQAYAHLHDASIHDKDHPEASP